MLDEILSKLHLKSVDELTPDERETYRRYSTLLAKPDTTIDDLKAFLPKELERAHAELRKFDNSDKRQMYYAAYAEFCSNLTKIIIVPAKEREALRAQLKQKFHLD